MKEVNGWLHTAYYNWTFNSAKIFQLNTLLGASILDLNLMDSL